MSTQITDDNPPPTTTLQLYRRLFKGTKHLFAPSAFSPAQFFITNPIPHKHHSSWKPIFYRGDNPKYTPTTTAIGRARRTALWNSFRLWLGDGVHEVLENEERRRNKRRVVRKKKWRRRFRMKPKPPKKPVEEEKEVVGKVVLVRMQRRGFLHRMVEWEVEGEQYRWSGTRRFAGQWMKHVKGFSHNLKLIRKSDGGLIATFEKDRWASFSKSHKTGGPPNKKKHYIGELQIYPAAYAHPTSRMNPNKTGRLEKLNLKVTTQVDHIVSGSPKKDDEKVLNPEGPHSGNLTEDAIVLSCWIIVEAEHRLRHKILDFLEEVGEEFEGG